jgi:hypothetical protein
MYEIIDKFFEEIHDMNWASETGKLSILGGIMINCDEKNTDRFLPLKFDVFHKNGERDDLF